MAPSFDWLHGILFTSAVFLNCLLWSVDLYDAICCRIVSIPRLSECVINKEYYTVQEQPRDGSSARSLTPTIRCGLRTWRRSGRSMKKRIRLFGKKKLLTATATHEDSGRHFMVYWVILWVMTPVTTRQMISPHSSRTRSTQSVGPLCLHHRTTSRIGRRRPWTSGRQWLLTKWKSWSAHHRVRPVSSTRSQHGWWRTWRHCCLRSLRCCATSHWLLVVFRPTSSEP